MRDPRSTAVRLIILSATAIAVSGCGLFGVAGPGLGPVGKQINPKCAGIPNQNPASCPLAGIGATEQEFENAHAYVGSTVVIPGQTNYLDLHDVNGLVSSFVEEYHAIPQITAGEAREETHAEMPYDAKKIFEKTVDATCALIEYKSRALGKVFDPQHDAVLIELHSPGPDNYNPNDVSSATLTVAAPVTRAAATC
jgi:hypothetical protein